MALAIALLCSAGAWADDVFKDVTSTYLTNADFEGEYSVYSNPSSDRAIYQPTGWTVSYTNGKQYDMTSLNSSCLQWSQFSGKAQPTNGGNNVYWVRFNNSHKDQQLELSQTVVLPKGTYKLSADYYKNGSGGDGYIFVNSTTKNNGANENVWHNLSIDFTSDGSSKTKIGHRTVHTNTYEKFLAYDNFVLKWNLTQSLTALLSEANTFYTAEGDSYTALKAVIDATNTSSTDADDLETQYIALAAALDLAKNHRKPWLTAWTTASTNYGSDTYVNVTGSEKTNLKTEIDKAEPSTADDYDTAKTALETANTTFTAAKTNYDALAVVNGYITAAGTLSYADSDKKPSTVVATSSSDAETKTASQYTALRAYYESHAAAEGVATAFDLTSRIVDAENPSNISAWTLTNTTGDSKMRTNSGESYTDADGTGSYKYFDSDSWGAAFAATFTQDLTLPAGDYLLTVKARGNGTTTYKVIADDDETVITSIGNTGGVFGRGWNDYSVVFTLDSKKDVTFGIEVETGSSSNWISFGDFRLVKLDATFADSDDYDDLTSAISTAEGHALGFDTGEYAPYRNVDALEKLAIAKAFDPLEDNLQSEVQEATTNLSGATWTQNDSEVDGVYDGTFSVQDEHTSSPTTLTGWTAVEGIRQLIKNTEDYPGLTSTEANAAVFAWGGTTITYGDQTAYTLPLNAYTIYEISFKMCGWKDGDLPSWISASLMKKEGGSSERTLTTSPTSITKRISESEPFVTFTYKIITEAEGDYQLKIYANKHYVISDISIIKAASQTLTFKEDGTTQQYVAGTYPTVALNRSFSTENRSTLVLPFAMDEEETAAAFDEVYELTSVVGESIKFSTATEIVAGKPYLIKAKNATLSVKEKALDPSQNVTNTIVEDESSTVTFVGLFAPTSLTADDNENAFIVSSNKLYHVASDINMAAYRGYFTVDSKAGVKNFVLSFDDDATAIDAVETTQQANAEIYNLAGQRLSKVQKGVNIVNGRKVLVK